jgi:hypothetical protein
VASSVGKPDYGILRPPRPLDPHYTPRAALDEFWPGVKFIFADPKTVPQQRPDDAPPQPPKN